MGEAESPVWAPSLALSLAQTQASRGPGLLREVRLAQGLSLPWDKGEKVAVRPRS